MVVPHYPPAPARLIGNLTRPKLAFDLFVFLGEEGMPAAAAEAYESARQNYLSQKRLKTFSETLE